MFGTINCTYETPCGWCAKWDKKCDRKIGCNNKEILEPKDSASIQTQPQQQSEKVIRDTGLFFD